MMSSGGTERRVDEIRREPADMREQTAKARRDVGAVILEEVTAHALEVVVHHERGVLGVAERAGGRPLIHQLEAPLGQLQALGHLLPPDQHRPRADAVLVSVEEFPGRGHPAEEVRPFQDKHFRAALGQHVRGDQTVVACPDDDRVVVRHADLLPIRW